MSYKLILIITIISFSCNNTKVGNSLECLLDSFMNVCDIEDSDFIEVVQHNGWTDTSMLLIISLHKANNAKYVNFEPTQLKSSYRGYDIYFSQFNVDSSDHKKYEKIPNAINWKIYNKRSRNDFTPPYDPFTIQIEYHIKSKCFKSSNLMGRFKKQIEVQCGFCK